MCRQRKPKVWTGKSAGSFNLALTFFPLFGPSHEEFHVNGHFHCEIIFSSPCFGSMV
ncbi:hypothetical protein SXCC_00154 [Gluconacetobacter sp. SXCC-1]|nr:hypothetical protein SXCC_00154 [Gluconacetobacter sp. SXCC-1]